MHIDSGVANAKCEATGIDSAEDLLHVLVIILFGGLAQLGHPARQNLNANHVAFHRASGERNIRQGDNCLLRRVAG